MPQRTIEALPRTLSLAYSTGLHLEMAMFRNRYAAIDPFERAGQIIGDIFLVLLALLFIYGFVRW